MRRYLKATRTYGWATTATVAMLLATTLAGTARAADQPKPGRYTATLGVNRVFNEDNLSFTLTPHDSGALSVFGTITKPGSWVTVVIEGTYRPRLRTLTARGTYYDDGKVVLPIDATWDPALNAFKVTLKDSRGDAVETVVAKPAASKPVDLVFCIDSTSSMKDELVAVAASTSKIMNELKAQAGDIRIRLVTFSDHTESRVVKQWDWTTDTAKMEKDIRSITAAGGGDLPEAVYTGLMTAINSSWRDGVLKIIVLIGDAPPHTGTKARYSLGDVERRALEVDPADIYPIAVANGGRVDPTTLAEFGKIADGCRGEVVTSDTAEELPAKITAAVCKAIAQSTGGGGSIGNLVISDALQDGRPVNPATAFSTVSKVYAWMEYDGMSAGKKLTASWQGPLGQTTSETELGGKKGTVWFSWSASGAGGYPAGNYSIRIADEAGNVLASRGFTVGR